MYVPYVAGAAQVDGSCYTAHSVTVMCAGNVVARYLHANSHFAGFACYHAAKAG